jgi:hypothetical protein
MCPVLGTLVPFGIQRTCPHRRRTGCVLSCLKAGRDGAVRQFCLKAIDIDLAQQIKESQNSEAKATSCPAYQEMVRAWVMLAECAEQLVNAKPFIRSDLAA